MCTNPSTQSNTPHVSQHLTNRKRLNWCSVSLRRDRIKERQYFWKVDLKRGDELVSSPALLPFWCIYKRGEPTSGRERKPPSFPHPFVRATRRGKNGDPHSVVSSSKWQFAKCANTLSCTCRNNPALATLSRHARQVPLNTAALHTRICTQCAQTLCIRKHA